MIDLGAMTDAEKDVLIRSLLRQFNEALAQISVLETRIEVLTRPPKTPDNSSIPPSKAAKPDRSVQKELRRRRGRPGTARDQQRVRARFAAERGAPQGDKRVQGGVGSRDLRRVPLRRQHREGTG